MVTARASRHLRPGRPVGLGRAPVRPRRPAGLGAAAEVVDDAVVLVSELVTNAVVHAGTAAEVSCLREEDSVQIRVTDRHPERGLPAFSGQPVDDAASEHFADAEGEGGRGLLMCSALSSRWGVEYTAGQKTVWFRLPLQRSAPGTRYALPQGPGEVLPSTDGPVLVAVVQVDCDGRVQSWNADAEGLFQYPAAQVVGTPWAERVVWPQSAITATGLAETLRLARWEGTFAVRRADQRAIEVYGSQVRVLDSTGTPSTLCLMVRDRDRAVLCAPLRTDTPGPVNTAVEPLDLLADGVRADDLSALLQRTVERTRDLLDGDAAYLLLTTEDESEFEVRASTGLPGPTASTSPRSR